MNRNDQVVQGDVLLTPVSEVPAGAKKLQTRTIALGEATGHHHTFTEGAELMELDGRVWVVVGEHGAGLEHQEHGVLVFPPGVWEYSPQIEPDPFTGLARRVQD